MVTENHRKKGCWAGQSLRSSTFAVKNLSCTPKWWREATHTPCTLHRVYTVTACQLEIHHNQWQSRKCRENHKTFMNIISMHAGNQRSVTQRQLAMVAPRIDLRLLATPAALAKPNMVRNPHTKNRKRYVLRPCNSPTSLERHPLGNISQWAHHRLRSFHFPAHCQLPREDLYMLPKQRRQWGHDFSTSPKNLA